MQTLTYAGMLPLTITANNEIYEPGQRYIINYGSDLILKCLTLRTHHKFTLFLYKNDFEIARNDTHELEYVNTGVLCQDSGVYTCLYDINERSLFHAIEFHLMVDNCSVFIHKFVSYNRLESDKGNVVKTCGSELQILCVVASHLSPIKLTIKLEGQVAPNLFHSTDLVLLSKMSTNCLDTGLYTCELEDVHRNVTYKEDIAVWFSCCAPYLCDQENIPPVIIINTTISVSVELCFNMPKEDSFNEIFIFKKYWTLVENNTKYNYNVQRFSQVGYKYWLYFKIFNIVEEDIGVNALKLSFENRIKLMHNFTLYTNGSLQENVDLDERQQYLCDQETILPVIFVSSVWSVSLDICFNMHQKDSFNGISIYKNGVWMRIQNSTKYTYILKRLDRKGNTYFIKLKIFNVAEDEVGENALELLFKDGNSIHYNFSISRNGSIQENVKLGEKGELTPVATDLFLEIVLPLIILIVVIAFGALLALCMCIRERVKRNIRSQGIHETVDSGDYQYIDELNMININEDDDCYNNIVDDENEIMETHTSLSSKSNSPEIPNTITFQDMYSTPSEAAYLSLIEQKTSQADLTSFKRQKTEIMDDEVLNSKFKDNVNRGSLRNLEHANVVYKNNIKTNAPGNLFDSDLNEPKEHTFDDTLEESCYQMITENEDLRKEHTMKYVDTKGYSKACEVYTDHTYLSLTNMNIGNIVLDKLETENDLTLVGEVAKSSPLKHVFKANECINLTDSHNFLVEHNKPLELEASFTDCITATEPNVTFDGQKDLSACNIEFDEYITPKTPKISHSSIASSLEIMSRLEIPYRNISDDYTKPNSEEGYIDFDGCESAKL